MTDVSYELKALESSMKGDGEVLATLSLTHAVREITEQLKILTDITENSTTRVTGPGSGRLVEVAGFWLNPDHVVSLTAVGGMVAIQLLSGAIHIVPGFLNDVAQTISYA